MFLLLTLNMLLPAGVFLIQGESTDMILKTLNSVKKWNPKVSPSCKDILETVIDSALAHVIT